MTKTMKLTAITLAALTIPAFADTATEINVIPRLTIGGYDTVAYIGKRFMAVLNIRQLGMTRAVSLPTKKIWNLFT
jgi:hypothetical protein